MKAGVFLECIKFFIYGIIFLYILQISDIMTQIISSFASIIITKHQFIINQYQKEIQDLISENEIQERTPAIGFVCNSNQYNDGD